MINVGDFVISVKNNQVGLVTALNGLRARIELYDEFNGALTPTNQFIDCMTNELDLYSGSDIDNLSDAERGLWNSTYLNVYKQTNDELKAVLAAQGSVSRERTLVSFKSDTNTCKVSGWGLIFSDSDKKDLQNTYFDQTTMLLTEYFQSAPLWYEHGADPQYGQMPIGKRSKLEVYPRGIWVEHELDMTHPLFEKTYEELKRGELSYSSDSISHFVEEGWSQSDGFLGVWPLAGWSLVKRPAEPGLGPVRLNEFVSAVKSIGTFKEEFDDTLAILNSLSQRDLDKIETVTCNQLLNVQSGKKVSTAFLNDLCFKRSYKTHEFLLKVYDSIQNIKHHKGDRGMHKRLSRFERRASSRELPFHTSDSGDDKHERVRDYKSVNYNRGSRKPGLTDIILGHITKNSAMVRSASKSMSFSDNVAGGYIVNREIAAEILNPLYATEAVIAAGADVIPMDGIETLTTRKMTSGVDAYWAGEGQAGVDADPTFGVVTLNLRELVARVRIPNRLLNNTTDLEAKVREDIVKRMRLKMDQSFLFGTGSKSGSNTGAEPLGVVNWPGVTNTALGTGDGARPKLSDLTQAVQRIETSNVEPTDTWSWIMHPRTKTSFTEMTDTTGQPLLRVGSWATGEAQELLGLKYYTTTQVPINTTVGNSTNTSYIVLGDWQYAVVGMGLDVEITVDTSRYINERETLVQAVAMCDFGLYYEEAFEVISAVTP